jgi:sugar phosphate isomerase/epimerase
MAIAKTVFARATRIALTVVSVFVTDAAWARTQTAYGAELYTVRAEMAQDFEGTLRRVAGLGYTQVEFVGLFGHEPNAVHALLDQLHLKVVGSQVDWKRLRDDPARLIAETKALGSPYIIYAWMPPEERATLAQWKKWIAHFNAVARMARAKGVRFAYHNHDFEFQAIDGVRPIDLLMTGLDPKFVDFEIDLYWMTLGGGDPVDYFVRFPGRFPLAHVKDMSRAGTEMVDAGDGRINFPRIFATSKLAGLKYRLVEDDNTAEPFRTLERGLAYLKRIEPK